MTFCLTTESPLGPLTLHEEEGAITALRWEVAEAEEVTPLLEEAARQLGAYFAGRLQAFDLPLRVAGSAFQQAVCAQMQAIPYGETRTYGDLAKALSQPAQAVGGACGGNPIPILIPCHRVVGAGGLTGFSGAGGVETKAALLRLEGALLI